MIEKICRLTFKVQMLVLIHGWMEFFLHGCKRKQEIQLEFFYIMSKKNLVHLASNVQWKVQNPKTWISSTRSITTPEVAVDIFIFACSVLKPNFRTFVSLWHLQQGENPFTYFRCAWNFPDELAHFATTTIWPLSKWTSVKNSLGARLSCNYIHYTAQIENAIY